MGWWEHCVSDTRRMLKESKVTAGICRPVEAEYGVWPSLSKLHKAASLSAADSDSTLVATSWVASAVRCLQDFQLTLPRGVRVRVYGWRPPTELGGWLTRTVSIIISMLIVYLESTFKKYRTVVGSSSSPNEALSRAFIILVIFSCVLEERMLLDKPSAY